MKIISQETFDKFTEEEKKKLRELYSNSVKIDFAIMKKIFGEENLLHEPKNKTWRDIIVNSHNIYDKELNPNCGNALICCITNKELRDKINLKTQATIKIAKLIELGYGGMITDEEWENENKSKWVINCDLIKEKKFEILELFLDKFFIAFHEESQAEEFMSYPENVELLKQYYMI